MFEPAKPEFIERFSNGEGQLVYTRLVADLETPVSAMLKLSTSRENCFLLESVEGGANRARYSIIGVDPDVVFRAFGNEAEINREALTNSQAFSPCALPTLDALRELVSESNIPLPESLPPMAAGVFGYLGYDTIRLIEHLPDINPDPIGTPDAIMIRPTVIVIFDNVKDEIIVVTPVRANDTEGDADRLYEAAIERLRTVIDQLDGPIDRSAIGGEADFEINISSNTEKAEYLNMVARAKEYIAAGDIFQVVLAQRFEAEFTLPPFSLYRALRRTNPAPYLFYLKYDGFSVAGSSPEILVRVRDGDVTVRPIAGTRPRGATNAEDKAYADDLLSDPKELAEHLMLLDLGRNDVGRVSEIGSVEVTDKFFLEYYSHVMHIVSNVKGRLAEGHDMIAALAAGFPAGTVSGAPKVRAMEIIDELEHEKRGIYAGCVGYFTADGDMDTCIVLRTSIVKDGKMYVQSGAGIVADSDPESEFQECVNKAKALFRAAEEAVRFSNQSSRGQ